MSVAPLSPHSPHPGSSTRREQRALVPQVLAAVGLPEAHNSRRLHTPRLDSAARRHTKTNGNIVHGHDDDALVLGAVLGVAADVRLQDVAAVQERHDTVGTDPDLVAGVFCDDGEGGDVEAELARLCEFAWTQELEMTDNNVRVQFDVPKHVPTDSSLSRATEVARLATDNRT